MTTRKDIEFYITSLPNVLKAYKDTYIEGNKPENDEREFRQSKCISCPLFNGSNCNKNLFHSNDNGIDRIIKSSVVDEFLENENNSKIAVLTYDHAKRPRKIKIGGITYYRGCGCPLTGDFAKWKLYFSKESLAKTDGLGPCPMGKWDYKNTKNEPTSDS